MRRFRLSKRSIWTVSTAFPMLLLSRDSTPGKPSLGSPNACRRRFFDRQSAAHSHQGAGGAFLRLFQNGERPHGLMELRGDGAVEKAHGVLVQVTQKLGHLVGGGAAWKGEIPV